MDGDGTKLGLSRSKSVKFSEKQEEQNALDNQTQLVPVRKTGTKRDSKNAAKRRRMLRKLRLYLSPKYWVLMLNKWLPVVHPDSARRVAWDGLMMSLVLFNCIIVPYQVGFGTPAPNVVEPLNNAIDVTFAVDIVLNFRTAYTDHSANLIRDGKLIAVHYIRTWFVIDFISTIPLDLIFSAIFSNLSQTQLVALSLLKTPRLLRLVRLLRIIDRMQGAVTMRMLKLLFLMATIAHWVACLWHLLYKLLPHNYLWTFDQLNVNSAEITFYLFGYLNTLFIMIGNDVFPGNDIERVYCTLVLVLGACFYAIIVGNMSLLINNINPTASRHKFKKDIINNTVRYLDIPKNLAQRINNYFEFLTQFSHPGSDGNNLINQLPSSMAQDINIWCYKDMLIKVPLFTSCEESFITQLVMRIKLSVYLTREVIFQIGDVGHEMYFISKGTVAVVNGNQELLAILSKGGFFGELALLATARRTANCVSIAPCDLAMLMANDLVAAMRDFPESAAKVRACAVTRLNELQAAGTAGSPDDAEESGDMQGDDVNDQDMGSASEPPHEDDDQNVQASAPGTQEQPYGSEGNRPSGTNAPNPPQRPNMKGPFHTLTSHLSGDSSHDAQPTTPRPPRDARRPSMPTFNRSKSLSRDADDSQRTQDLERQYSVTQEQDGSGRKSRGLIRQLSKGPGSQAANKSFTAAGRRASVLARLESAKSKDSVDGSLYLVGQIHTIITRLNGKMDTMNGRLDDMTVRIQDVEDSNNDPFARNMSGAPPAVDPLMDYALP